MGDGAPPRLVEGADDYDPVPCPLCGSPLHLNYMADQYLYASFTEADMRGVRGDDLEGWTIGCENGHIVMVPVDDGAESHVFGICTCDPDEGHPEGAACHDFDRLRSLLLRSGINFTE